MSLSHHKHRPRTLSRNGNTYRHRGGDRYTTDRGEILDTMLLASILAGDSNHGFDVSNEYSNAGDDFSAGGGADYSGGGSSESYGGDSGGGDSGGGGGDSGGGGGGD